MNVTESGGFFDHINFNTCFIALLAAKTYREVDNKRTYSILRGYFHIDTILVSSPYHCKLVFEEYEKIYEKTRGLL